MGARLADRRRDDALAFSRWTQPYLVLSCCRMLQGARERRGGLKQTAGTWALATLDSRWHLLIRAALADRPEPVGAGAAGLHPLNRDRRRDDRVRRRGV